MNQSKKNGKRKIKDLCTYVCMCGCRKQYNNNIHTGDEVESSEPKLASLKFLDRSNECIHTYNVHLHIACLEF